MPTWLAFRPEAAIKSALFREGEVVGPVMLRAGPGRFGLSSRHGQGSRSNPHAIVARRKLLIQLIVFVPTRPAPGKPRRPPGRNFRARETDFEAKIGAAATRPCPERTRAI